jgi:hypothetical protein
MQSAATGHGGNVGVSASSYAPHRSNSELMLPADDKHEQGAGGLQCSQQLSTPMTP